MTRLFKGTQNEVPKHIDPKNNICVVKEDTQGNKEWYYGANIVTNDGDIYYAKKACAETPASNENFAAVASGAGATCILRNHGSAITPAKDNTYNNVSSPIVSTGAQKDCTSAYPKTNDGDSDNSGAGVDVVTYKFSWTTSQIDTSSGNAITGGCIVDKAATLGANPKILTHWNFSSPTSFHKTATDTLTLYVNHTMNGV